MKLNVFKIILHLASLWRLLMVGHAYQKAYSGQRSAHSIWWGSTPLFRLVCICSQKTDINLCSPHNPLNLNFPHTDWSSCSKPGWWTSCKHANRKGYHRPSRTGCPQGFWAEWREIKNWGICSTDEGSLVALGVVNESTFKVRQIGEACFCHFIYSM